MKLFIVRLFNLRSSTLSQRQMDAFTDGGTDTLLSDAGAAAMLGRVAL